MTPFPQSSHMIEGRHAIRFGDGIAVLDIAGDAYSCVYDPADEATADAFPDTRSVRSDPARSPTGFPTASGPWRDLPSSDAKVRPRDILRFIAALIVTAIRFRRIDFAGLLDTGKGDGPIRGEVLPDEIATIVARFERMALFLPIPILCLFRSSFLLQFLTFHGCSADWVFGVTLFPFRAHCWLASGDLLLGEKSARAVQFSTIHVVKARYA